ncbi:MAG: restriction endonuclease subunit S, partial [Fusobacteriaceae bacterium]
MVQFILDNFDTIFRNEKSFQTFDKMILDLAVRGKLVPQIEDEEPASKLLQRIKEEKERLISEKVIKKEKPLPPITKDEKPYNIPNSWEWVRLGDILTKLTDGAHHTPTYIENGIPFLSVKDISKGKINFSKVKYISKEEHDVLYKRCNPEKNDLLLTKIGTTGIAKVIDIENEFSLFVSVALLKFNKDLIYPYYLENLINSPLVKNQSSENTKGVGNKNLVLKSIAGFIIPLPPLKEQEKIVEKVKKLQELSKKFKEIYNSNEKTRANLKKAILEEVEKSDTNNELLISLE